MILSFSGIAFLFVLLFLACHVLIKKTPNRQAKQNLHQKVSENRQIESLLIFILFN